MRPKKPRLFTPVRDKPLNLSGLSFFLPRIFQSRSRDRWQGMRLNPAKAKGSNCRQGPLLWGQSVDGQRRDDPQLALGKCRALLKSLFLGLLLDIFGFLHTF